MSSENSVNLRPQDCGSFDRCDATLCPLGAAVGWLEHAVWFPGEAICIRQGKKPRWVSVQRRIDRVTGGDPSRGYFTVRMLDTLTAVHRSIRGLDVDVKDEATAEDAWCAKRKRLELTPEQAARRREKGERLAATRLASLGTVRSEKTVATPGAEEVAGQTGIPGHVEGVSLKPKEQTQILGAGSLQLGE